MKPKVDYERSQLACLMAWAALLITNPQRRVRFILRFNFGMVWHYPWQNGAV